MHSIRIRCVVSRDPQSDEVLSRLHQQCFRICEFDPDLMVRAVWWVAFDEDNRALAFAGFVPRHENSGAGYLCRAGVLPHARGQGLHRELIQVRLAFARRSGSSRVVTDTLRNRRCAQNLLACGFQSFQPRRPWGLSAARYWQIDLTAVQR